MQEAECIVNESWGTFELSPVAFSPEGGRNEHSSLLLMKTGVEIDAVAFPRTKEACA